MGDYGKTQCNFDHLDIASTSADDYSVDELKVKSKQSPEEKHLLKSCTVELDDGSHGYVFSFEEDERGVGSWFCHICQVALYGWTVVNSHISGKKHSTNIQKSYHPRANFSRIVEDTTVELQPGEPAPPGMEDIVEPKKCIIQSKLDAFKSKPLIGLEFLVELATYDGTDPTYCCLLCNKHGVSNNIIVHLSSQQHQLKYLQNFFSNTYSALVLVPRTSEYKKGFSVVLNRIISRIEGKYGRLKPRQCLAEDFPSHKATILREMNDEYHFRETLSDDYVNMVDWTEIRKLQFYNEDDEVVPVTSTVDATSPTGEKSAENKSLFNKLGRINVDKRQLRRDRGSAEDKSKESSPDVVIVEDLKPDDKDKKKLKSDRKSLSSVSSISSDSLTRSRSRSRTRPGDRKRNRSPNSRRHYRSRSRSTSRRRRIRNSIDRRYSRSRSRSSGRHGRRRSRSKSPSYRYRYKRNRSPQLPYPRRLRRSYSRSRSRSPYQKDVHEPHNRRYGKRKMYSDSVNEPNKVDKNPDKYKWEKFREELQAFTKNLEGKQKYYEKNPEKHPQYPEEWKLFWNRRYKELQAEGQDPAKHDFKPEWIVYWNNRMKDMYNEEFKTVKIQLKEKLGLLDNVKQTGNDGSIDKGKDVTIDDIKNTWKALTGSEIKEPAKSPTSSLIDETISIEDRSNTHLRARLPPPGARLGFVPFDDNAPRVISVLRLITVLESQLGSLGPKVVSLLSKAIAMEKVYKGSSQEILLDEEHCVLFETVKEKLKGMLFAGLVDRNFVNTTKVALRNIEDLFLSIPKVFKREVPAAVSAPPPARETTSGTADTVTVPGVGSVDRVAIAQQIAGALIAQGKTDVTEEELEQLINAVVGMAQASANSSEPVTTAAYISQQTQNVPASGALKLLQSAYDDDDKKMSADETSEQHNRNPQLLISSEKELSDQDLKSLVENFSELSSKEQLKLISYIKKLDATDPGRLLALQKVMNVRELLGPAAEKIQSLSTLSANMNSLVNTATEDSQKKNNDYEDDDDDDDDDYSVEDVYKAASEKLRQQELTQERKKIESILANIAEAAKKGDSMSDLSETLTLTQNKGATSAENAHSSQIPQHSTKPEQSQHSSDRLSQNYPNYFQPPRFQQPGTEGINNRMNTGGYGSGGNGYEGNSSYYRSEPASHNVHSGNGAPLMQGSGNRNYYPPTAPDNSSSYQFNRVSPFTPSSRPPGAQNEKFDQNNQRMYQGY